MLFFDSPGSYGVAWNASIKLECECYMNGGTILLL